MAKGQDPFEKFRNATLNGSPLSDALKSSTASPAPSEKTPESEVKLTPALKKESKISSKEQIGFYLDKELKRSLGLLKYETGISFNDLYEEAIRDLLKKYHKI